MESFVGACVGLRIADFLGAQELGPPDVTLTS